MMTVGKNSNSESKEEQPKNERKFNQEHYDRLIECSEKGPEGIKKWNEWRVEDPSEDIWLQGAYLEREKLQGVDLQFAKLQGANLENAKLQGAELHRIKLQGANLQFANLQGATFFEANLQGANLHFAKLQGAKFMGAIVNGSTNFLGCEIDENTDFRETALENVRIESGTKICLKYNIRRMNWRDWYAKHPRLEWIVRHFWDMSDYGISTKLIIKTFFIMAMCFAIVYYLWGAIDCYLLGNTIYPGIIANLFVDQYGAVSWWLVPLRSIYFSIVTMTTLGFGDMYANTHNYWFGAWGHLLLGLQVLMGYVLLGALITRLAVLFTSDGPAGEFTPMDKETKQLLAKLKEDKGN